MFFYTSQKKQLKEEKQKNQIRVSKSGRRYLNVTVELRVEFTVLSLSRHFCSYNNSLNIDLYTFFRNLKHVVSKYTYRRVHKDLKIVHDWKSQSLYLIPRNINQLNKPDNHRAPLVWENVLVLAGLDMRERQTGLNHLSNLGPAASFPSLCATGPLFCKFNDFDGKN